MEKASFFQTFGRFLRGVLLFDLLVAIAVAALCLIAGWRTVYQYGIALMYSGVILILLSILDVFGNWAGERNFGVQYALSASNETLPQRTQRMVKDALQSYGFMVFMVVSALLPLAIGVIIQLQLHGK